MLKKVWGETINSIRYFFKVNISIFPVIFIGLAVFTPWVFELSHRNGNEQWINIVRITLTIMFLILSYITRKISNIASRGKDMPVAEKRFSSVTDGEVSISQDRLHELILYIGELEEWQEKYGYRARIKEE